MSIEAALQDAVQNGVAAALAIEVQEIVVKETRRALRDREEALTQLIRAAVKAAFENLLADGQTAHPSV